MSPCRGGGRVAGRQLVVDTEYRDFDLPLAGSTCTARHGDRPVSCISRPYDYGHASNSIWISEQLGVTEPELTRLRDAVLWWQTVNGALIGAVVLLCVLAVAAGVTAYLSSRRTPPHSTSSTAFHINPMIPKSVASQ